MEEQTNRVPGMLEREETGKSSFLSDLEDDAQRAVLLLPSEVSSPYLSPVCTGLASLIFAEIREERKRLEKQNSVEIVDEG